MGSWITYGLGSENQDLPGFVVLISGGTDPTGGKALWSTGFLPSVYQGVQCRTVGDPILYVSDPKGMDRADRRRTLDALRRLNEYELAEFGDPETLTRISQYELAFRMQMAVPEVMDIRQEPEAIIDAIRRRARARRRSRTTACWPAGWSSGACATSSFTTGAGTATARAPATTSSSTCRRSAARSTGRSRRCSTDLKRRGLLDETLVIWGGEFGRTSMNEARGGSKFLGRDHHPHCFSIWMAGGGIKPGITVGRHRRAGLSHHREPDRASTTSRRRSSTCWASTPGS